MKTFITIISALGMVLFAEDALSAVFYEEFLGSRDDGGMIALFEGWKVAFNFDLTASGGRYVLMNKWGTVVGTGLPTVDETGYDPSLYFPPYEAYLSFTAYSVDLQRERARVKTSFMDGNKVLWEGWFNLNAWNGPRATKVFDLGAEGLLGYLADGRLRTIVIALDTPGWNFNDFGIEQAALDMKADPVPEPSTLFLLGPGLLSLGTYVNMRFRRKKG